MRSRLLLVLAAAVALLATERASAAVAGLLPRFVTVPAGHFLMGSPPDEAGSKVDEVQHTVRIGRAFALAVTEVTQALWEEVMGGNPSYFTGCPDCPVDRVSWYDALSFCNELSRRQGLVPVYGRDGDQIVWNPAANGYRLPTEAEWEYACRAGTTTAFHTGDCLDPQLANYDGYRPLAGCTDGLSRGESVPVGSLGANAWGLHDMHGNLAEWCWDHYGPYPRRDVGDPRGPAGGPFRIVRGGCWENAARRCRSANRQAMPPDRRIDMIGLRLARTVAP
jgi:formylglycine-generating enzyme required for sulfatase activity